MQWWYGARWHYCIKHKHDFKKDDRLILDPYCVDCWKEEIVEKEDLQKKEDYKEEHKRRKAITKLGNLQ